MIKKNFAYIIALYIFVLFFIISVWTPLAGDDWGYALTGMNNNPFSAALAFYQGWSGRFFSELYGFLIAPHKWLWNIINPSLFVIIFLSIVQIVKPRNIYSGSLIVLMWMLSIKDELRMETYTWIMGTTYVIPLALSLLFFVLVKESIFNNQKLRPYKKIGLVFLLFYIGLTMENISVVMFFLVLVSTLYLSINQREINVTWIVFSITSLISLLILRLSPGAAFRLARDHVAWTSMSLFEQIQSNYPQFIEHTFLDNKIFTLTFTLLLMALLFKSQKSTIQKILLSLSLAFALLISISLTLNQYFNNSFLTILIDSSSVINAIYWLLYIVILFYLLFTELNNHDRLVALFFLSAAGLANGAMLLSPIFGYRSSLFTLYFMMVVGLVLLNQFKMKTIHFVLSIFLVALILKDSFGIVVKYKLVKDTHSIRLEEIQYYKDNPDIKEAWLIRYPIFTIHGGDIEEDDTYHMETFKAYYGIENDVHLIFYYPE